MDFYCDDCLRTHHGADGTEHAPWPVHDYMGPDVLAELGPLEMMSLFLEGGLCLVAGPEGIECYVQVLLTLPVFGEPGRALHYAPWARVAPEDLLEHMAALREAERRRARRSARRRHPVLSEFDGVLATALPDYPDSLGQPVRLIAREQGEPTTIVPDPFSEHPLARDLRDGISLQEAELRVRSLALTDLAA